MPRIDLRPSRKTLNIIYIIDLSGSMRGHKAAAVNEAMRTVTNELLTLQEKEEYQLIEIRIRALGFNGRDGLSWSSNVGWIKDALGTIPPAISIKEFKWIDITEDQIWGETPTQDALMKIADMMRPENVEQFFGSYISSPLVILISDGKASNREEYRKACEIINDNQLAQQSVRISIGIGTRNEPDLINQLEMFGKNGFYNCDDTNLNDIADAIVKSTIIGTHAANNGDDDVNLTDSFR